MTFRYPSSNKKLSPEENLEAMDVLNDSTEKLEQLMSSDSGSDKYFVLNVKQFCHSKYEFILGLMWEVNSFLSLVLYIRVDQNIFFPEK